MGDPLVFESCHATWIFDTDAMQFRRIVKGVEVEGHPVATQWRPFFRLEFSADSEVFRVHLNESGTKLMQSWRHLSDCSQCAGHVTSELSLEEIEAALA
jgi:hypothetical protein